MELRGSVECCVLLREEDADVVRAEGGTTVAQDRGFRGAQGGEQQEDAGEMAGAETH